MNSGGQSRQMPAYTQHQGFGGGDASRSSPYGNRPGERGSGLEQPARGYGQTNTQAGHYSEREQYSTHAAGNGNFHNGAESRGGGANTYSSRSHLTGGHEFTSRTADEHTRLASGGVNHGDGRNGLGHGDSGHDAFGHGGAGDRGKGDARAALAQAQRLPSAHQRLSLSSTGRDFAVNGHSYRPFAAAAYAWPRGYGYRSIGVGGYLAPIFWSPDYFVVDYYLYGVPPPERDFAWIRYGPDLLLMQLDTGEVIQVISGVFVDGMAYGGFDAPPGFGPERTAFSGDPDELPGDPPPPGAE